MQELTRVRLHDVEVDLSTGEIRRDGLPGDDRSERNDERLPPQPARLLALLIERALDGDGLVSHEEIRARLWPDVEVDFESGLHFCVRQVRAALGDSAQDPRFVETLPRRGYRLLVTPEPVEPPTSDAAVPGSEPSPEPRSMAGPTADPRTGVGPAAVGIVGLMLLALFAVVLAWIGTSGRTTHASTGADPRPSIPRVAILPFEPPDAWAGATDSEIVPDLLLVALGNEPDSFEVLGSTSTAGHGADGPAREAIRAAFGVDWIVHGRYVEYEGSPALLAELIRATDGAHVRVSIHPLDDDPDAIAKALEEAVRSTVGAH